MADRLTLAGRRALRQHRLAVAKGEARRNWSSLNCLDRLLTDGPNHQPCGGGPANCLCECHDPQPEES